MRIEASHPSCYKLYKLACKAPIYLNLHSTASYDLKMLDHYVRM